MHSLLFEVFGTGFPSYFVLIFIGFLFASMMSSAWARRIGQNPDVMVDLGLIALISGFAGARLLHVLADGHFMDYVHACTAPQLVDWTVTEGECRTPDFGGVWDEAKRVCHPAQANCFAWAEFWSGGFTFYGGLIAATAAAGWLFRRDRFPFWKGVDMGGMLVPIGLGFGRLGCLLAGCCFGSVTEGAWALHFPGRSPASDWQARAGLLPNHLHPALPVHPTQLLEAGGAFAIAAFGILFLHERKRYDGQVFAAFLLAYSVLRFGVEQLRSDDRGGFWWFSTSQWISLILFGTGLMIELVRGRAERARQAQTGAVHPVG
jgi:phosphatidylglycerol---prolipoprotein diacylglyceryl transferase